MNKLEKLIAKLCPNGVEYKPLGEVVETISAPKKLNRKDYHDDGMFPIVDQGQSFIVGYTDDEGALIQGGPYVIFGDHTREVKYVDFPFVQGADGVKILRPVNGILVRFLFYVVAHLKIKSRGYNRHWPIASKLEIPLLRNRRMGGERGGQQPLCHHGRRRRREGQKSDGGGTWDAKTIAADAKLKRGGYLKSNSPCLRTGEPSYCTANGIATDLDGRERFHTDTGTMTVDMGCFENSISGLMLLVK